MVPFVKMINLKLKDEMKLKLMILSFLFMHRKLRLRLRLLNQLKGLSLRGQWKQSLNFLGIIVIFVTMLQNLQVT